MIETQAILYLKMVQSDNCRRLQEKCKAEIPHHVQIDTEDLNYANDGDCADN